MASITSRKNGTRLLQFKDQTGKRRTIQLGNMTMRSATSIRGKVEAILVVSSRRNRLMMKPIAGLTDLIRTFCSGFPKLGLSIALRFLRLGIFGNSTFCREPTPSQHANEL